jgi:hypothetical protein
MYALRAGLWATECCTITAVSELDEDAPCLQYVPLEVRRIFLQAVKLEAMAGIISSNDSMHDCEFVAASQDYISFSNEHGVELASSCKVLRTWSVLRCAKLYVMYDVATLTPLHSSLTTLLCVSPPLCCVLQMQGTTVTENSVQYHSRLNLGPGGLEQ